MRNALMFRHRAMALALRAFPTRWRADHGDEFLATDADLFVDRMSRALAVEVFFTIRAGFAVRLRTRPPLRHRLAYRWVNRPVPPVWSG